MRFTARLLVLRCAIVRARASGQSISMLSQCTASSSRYGRSIARRISRTAPSCLERSSRVSKDEIVRQRAYTKRRSGRRARTASSRTKALAHELAAQYYLARGLETAGYAHLRSARHCFERWGAHGKVKQLDERYPNLREERTSAASVVISPLAGQLDVEAVAKASQALSSEIVLPKLIEKLVHIAVENAGAERGLLILIRDPEPRIEAEATTGHNRVEVTVRKAVVTPSDLLAVRAP